jgi:hypothetical protein
MSSTLKACYKKSGRLAGKITTCFLLVLGMGGTTNLPAADSPPTNSTAVTFKLKDVDPSGAVYAIDGHYSVKINLEPIAQAPTSLDLRLNRGPSYSLAWVSNDNELNFYSESSTALDTNLWCVLDTGRSQLILNISSDRYVGNVKIAVGNDGGFSNAIQTTFAWCSPTGLKIFAFGLAVIMIAIPIGIIRLSGGRALKVAGLGKQILPKWLEMLILDRETATYSLSKFQLYLWLTVSVISYVYFVLAKFFIQGSFDFCDVPANLPTLLLVSAGTPVAATYISNTRGPKGAGDQFPSLSDLVSSGGVAAPDRFQMFVWTLLGSLYFLLLTLSIDPATISALPTIPGKMIDLMGLSSAGYLAGKFARKAGPVIDGIGVTQPADGSLQLTLRGRVLAKAAVFKINDTEITADRFATPDYRPDIQEPEDATKPDVTGQILVLKITNPDPSWKQGSPTLTISNPDGQNASLPFKAS